MSRICRVIVGAAFACAMLLGFGPAARAVSFKSLYSFCTSSECPDGSDPAGRLLQVGGDFYGTTSTGGVGGPPYSGTVFRVSAGGVFKTLHSFCVQTYCGDGSNPGKYLARAPNGDIYGVTQSDGGGANAGTVFKVTPAGEYTNIHVFCVQKSCLDGIEPVAVAFDASGDLFGTTIGGGAYREGIVFEITPGGTFRKLHDFCSSASCADGILPGALILGKDGDLYGTTKGGGAHQAGSVFKITLAGAFTTLYSFCALKQCADGEQPSQILAAGRDGNFYGTTALTGKSSGTGVNLDGTIFQLTPAGVLKTLYSFCARDFCYDGNSPLDGLSVAPDGSLYGTTTAGGRYYQGVLFNITTAGAYKIVHNFCAEHGCFDGAAPSAAPTVGSNGKLYGTAQAGGDKYNLGAIYEITP